jgi:hypothetical protein
MLGVEMFKKSVNVNVRVLIVDSLSCQILGSKFIID